MSDERNPAFPEVPTCVEQGFDVKYFTQRGMAVPKGIDPEVKARLETACENAIKDEDFVKFMENNGQAISYLNAADYTAFLEQSATDVAAAMEAVGL